VRRSRTAAPRAGARHRSPQAVLFVTVARGLGGPAQSLLTVLRHLEQVDAVLFAPDAEPARMAVELEAVTSHVPMPSPGRWQPVNRALQAVELARYARRHRHRLAAIHANGQMELNLCALASWVSGVPTVVWAHASMPGRTAKLLSGFWRRRRDVHWTAVSDVARSTLSATMGVGPTEIDLIPNPIDPAAVLAPAQPHDGLRVAYLGVPMPHKGFGLLGPTLRRLRGQDIEFDLYVGSPPDDSVARSLGTVEAWSELRRAARDARIHLRGRVSDVREIYQRADIVICPSRNESFSRVAAEAMLNGLPVVASDIPAHRQLLTEPAAGLLFPVDDAAAAAAAIAELAENPPLRRELGERGRERAACFTPKATVEQLEARYLAGGGRTRR
jgi:glycosyltransferase involved in cell wall biosynthesis